MMGAHVPYGTPLLCIIYICLRGKIKGEYGIRKHILPCASKTKSGFDVKSTIHRLMELKISQRLVDGPAISNVRENILNTHFVNKMTICCRHWKWCKKGTRIYFQ